MDHEFLEPWNAISEDNGEGLVAELYKEVIKGHPLYGKQVSLIARRYDCDEILVKVVKEKIWASVHLTWSMKPEQTSTVPFTVVFNSWEAVYKQLILVDHQDFEG
jgi:hypothetical protein